MSAEQDKPVSHGDIYHKLGKLEGVMDTMVTTVGSFHAAVRDVHTRIDSLEARQHALESRQFQENGASSALSTLMKDYALPLAAVAVAWFAGRSQAPASPPAHVQPQAQPGIIQPVQTAPNSSPRSSSSR